MVGIIILRGRTMSKACFWSGIRAFLPDHSVVPIALAENGGSHGVI